VGLYSSAGRRGYATYKRKKGLRDERPVGPNLPQINEETGGVNEVVGEEGPDMNNAGFVNGVSCWWCFILGMVVMVMGLW